MSQDLLIDPKKKFRYDYFLIWGNGLQYKWEILKYLNTVQNIEIILIKHYEAKSIKNILDEVYSYSYAQYQHINNKTRYLLKSSPEVLFIFIMNKDPVESFYGVGDSQHIECKNIKQIKEDIRNKYNPRKNGKRTEEHVIHGSDNETQVDHILKFIGYSQGITFLKNIPNPILNVPYTFPVFDKFVIKNIDTITLKCNILRGYRNDYRIEMISIQESPQFQCISGNVELYSEYLNNFLGGPLSQNYSVEKLLNLSKQLNYLKKPFDNNYIIVKELSNKIYLIQDGLHRASILIHRGHMKLPVAVIL